MGKKNKKNKGKNKNKNFVRPPEPPKMRETGLWFTMPHKEIYDTYCKHGVQTGIAFSKMADDERVPKDALISLEAQVYDMIMPGIKSITSSKYLDQALNIYLDEDALKPRTAQNPGLDARAKFLKECDVIDFEEYVKSHDVFAEAMARVNQLTNKNDISYLWATNEYVRIKVGPGLEYDIEREKYDPEANTVYYKITIYETYKLYGDHVMTVPTTIMHGHVSFDSLGALETILNMAELTSMVINLDRNAGESSKSDVLKIACDSIDEIKADIADRFAEEAKDKDIEIDLSKIIVPTFTIDEGIFIAQMSSYIKKYIDAAEYRSKNEDAFKSVLYDLAANTTTDVFFGCYMDMENKTGLLKEDGTITTDISKNEKLAYNVMRHMIQKAAAPLAYIIVVNGMIADKKASKPIRKIAKSAKSETEPQDIGNNVDTNIDNNDKTEQANDDTEGKRKLRILDGTIPISSTARLLKPNMRRVANYTVSEWGRKGHLRHYKNGKTVEIKSTTVRRRKINNGETKPKTGTDYIIKPGKDKNKDEKP